MSNTSMPANFLNSTALPSITGLEASGPILPRPSNRRAVRDHRHQIGAGGQGCASAGCWRSRCRRRQPPGNRPTPKVALVGERLDRLDLELARPTAAGDRRAPHCGVLRMMTTTCVLPAFPALTSCFCANRRKSVFRQIEPDVKHAQTLGCNMPKHPVNNPGRPRIAAAPCPGHPAGIGNFFPLMIRS